MLVSRYNKAGFGTWRQTYNGLPAKGRMKAIRCAMCELADDTSSHGDRNFAASRNWLAEDEALDVGEVVAWIFDREEQGIT